MPYRDLHHVASRTRALRARILSYKAQSVSDQEEDASQSHMGNRNRDCDRWLAEVTRLGEKRLKVTLEALSTYRDTVSKCYESEKEYNEDCTKLRKEMRLSVYGELRPHTTSRTSPASGRDTRTEPPAVDPAVVTAESRLFDKDLLARCRKKWTKEFNAVKHAGWVCTHNPLSRPDHENLQDHVEKYVQYRETVSELSQDMRNLSDPVELSAYTEGGLDAYHHMAHLYVHLDPRRGHNYTPWVGQSLEGRPFWEQERAWDPWLTDDLKRKSQIISAARQLISVLFESSGFSPAPRVANIAILTASATYYDLKLGELQRHLTAIGTDRRIFIDSIVKGEEVLPEVCLRIPTPLLSEAQSARTALKDHLDMTDPQSAPELASLCRIDIGQLEHLWPIPGTEKCRSTDSA